MHYACSVLHHHAIHEFDTWLRTRTSKLEAQRLSLTLDMGAIVAETCKLKSEACNEQEIKQHISKNSGTVNAQPKPHVVHLNRRFPTQFANKKK